MWYLAGSEKFNEKMSVFTLKKGEKLKSRKTIEQMFQVGQSFAKYPLRLVWMKMEERQSAYPAQFSVSASKKRFKKAVTRNRIKRLVREAYRLNKQEWYAALENETQQYALMILYTGKEILTFEEISSAMKKLARRFADQLQEKNQN